MKNEKEDIEQLFYDLYNNTKNEKASIIEFNRLFKENYLIAKLHYAILSIYLEDTDNKCAERYSNILQDYIVKEIFN